MKITKIFSNPVSNCTATVQTVRTSGQQYSDNKTINNIFYNDIKITQRSKTIMFMGKVVHIVDGGNHATNMQHFAKAISNNINILMHNVEVNIANKNTKQLRSLETQLKYLNTRSSLSGEYIAIPALASVPLLNIKDQYNRVMKENQNFTPENMKANKDKLLAFLKEIYEHQSLYREYINYMDPAKQGIEYTYGVIQEINKLKDRGAKVYIPLGHPHEETLKWMAGENGLKPELYHYIATGNDVNNSIHEMHETIKRNNWYSFNLLSLSDANVVGVKGAKDAQDYMFAAYDSCITDGARGVYNFSPVRKNGTLVGYSYTDKTTNEYPYNEFPANDEIANLVKFVGKQYASVVATPSETAKLKDAIKYNRTLFYCPDKLFAIDDVFSQAEIQRDKLYLQGKYVDKTLKTFFDVNNNGEIIFLKCDCEGSGKPSVLPMWGSCFAVFNAIARDIKLSKNVNYENTLEQHTRLMQDLKKIAFRYGEESNYKKQEDTLNYIMEKDKAFSIEHPDYYLDFEPHYLLGLLHLKCGNSNYASSCFNNAINYLSKFLCGCKKINLQNAKSGYDKYTSSVDSSRVYDMATKEDNSLPDLFKLLSTKPTTPYSYGDYKYYKEEYEQYQKATLVADMFNYLADICRNKGEYYPAQICKAVADDIQKGTSRGNKVLELRSQGIQYLGNLYPEIKESGYENI